VTAGEQVCGVEISKPDKELFPGVTKLDLARYYERVADVMLPHLRGRPVNMQRYPDGVDGPSFYEKKVPKHFPDWVRTVEVEGADGPQRQVVVDDARTLVYLAQQACITPHTWLCREGSLEKPDQLIFDLDPSEGGSLRDVRRATRLVGELLDDLDLQTFVKTTGSRGYHVLVPLRPRLSFDDVRGFARECAEVLVAREPDLLTLEHRKAKRGTPGVGADHLGRAVAGAARPAHDLVGAAPAGSHRRPLGRGPDEAAVARCGAEEGDPALVHLEVLVGPAGQHRLVLGRRRPAAPVGAVVVDLHEQPVLLLAAHPRAPEGERAGELVPVQPHLHVAAGHGVGHRDRLAVLLGEVVVGAGVPHDHRALAVAVADPSLVVGVRQLVVLDLDGQPLLARVERRALRHRPGHQDAVDLESHVEVQRRGIVALDDEERSAEISHPLTVGVTTLEG
jgi:bifunctional non-homologous end joining protein LigD